MNELSAPTEILEDLDDPKLLSYYHGVNAVLNAAIGIKYTRSENVSWYAGFRTDLSNLPEFKQRNPYFDNTINFLKYDLYHATIGGRFRKDRFELVLGIQYSFAQKLTTTQLANFDDPVEYNDGVFLQGEVDNTMKFKYNELSVLAGMTYSFISDLVKKK